MCNRKIQFVAMYLKCTHTMLADSSNHKKEKGRERVCGKNVWKLGDEIMSKKVEENYERENLIKRKEMKDKKGKSYLLW